MADCWDSFVNLRVPSSAGNFLTSRRPVSLSGTNLLGGSYLDGNSCIYVQGVPGGMDKTSGECSLC